MGLVILLVLVVVCGGAVLLTRLGTRNAASRPAAKPKPYPPAQSIGDPDPAQTAESEITQRMNADLADITRAHHEERARIEAEMLAEIDRMAAEAWAEADEEPWVKDDEPEPDLSPTTILRSDYVPKELEERYLTRDDAGLPTLRLVDAGDRMAIWSPLDGGALVNPKGPGLRRLGLCASSARGAAYYEDAYRQADLSKGQWVDLKSEPDNPHGTHAVAMCAPGSGSVFAYVQRGRSAAVARRMDAGEDMAAVSLRGPSAGSVDGPALLLIGSRADLIAMLDA